MPSPPTPTPAHSARLEERLALMGVRPEDLKLLAELRPQLEQCADGFWRELLSELSALAPLRRYLDQPAVVDQLAKRSRGYLLSFTRERFDDEFVEERRWLGRALQGLGLEPHWVFRGYAAYFSLLVPRVIRGIADEGKASRVVAALGKRLAFDAELVIEAYIESQQRGLAHRAQAAEELASIATLVAGLAHEIGTPMSVIQGHAKLLERQVRGDPDAAWRVQTIREQISRISRIIDTLLKLANPRKAKPRRVKLGPLLEQCLAFLGDHLQRRKIEAKASLAAVPDLVGDAERLQQLFLNLFLNAADAMPGGGELAVELGAADGQLVVRVSDTGVGIAPEFLERIFEPFFTTKEAGHGNGLGLVVCKGIAADHGGRIEVQSEVGAGTEFTVALPAAPHEDGTATEGSR